MNSLNISTTVKAFKELLQMERNSYNLDKYNEYIERLSIIETSFNEKDFLTALILEKGLSFSFHKGEEQTEKEFQYILKNQILSSYVSHLESENNEFIHMAVTLLPYQYMQREKINKINFSNNDIEIRSQIKKINAEHFVLKDAVIHLFELCLKRIETIRTLKKDLAEIQHD